MKLTEIYLFIYLRDSIKIERKKVRVVKSIIKAEKLKAGEDKQMNEELSELSRCFLVFSV